MSELVDGDLLSLLRTPGGAERLGRDETALISGDGRRYPFQGGIWRTLEAVDPLLAKELQAQDAAVEEYLSTTQLMPLYERDFVARLAIEQMLDRAALPVGANVLDAGCGVGLLGTLYPELGMIGLDASLTLLGHVQQGYRLKVEGSAEALPFADGAFDLVIALNMLHHVITPQAALAEFARVLKPGGTLIAVDPRKVAPIELVKSLMRGGNEMFAATHKAFAVDEYAELIACHGAFAVEKAERVGLVGLLGMAGLDALGLSKYLPSQRLVTHTLAKLDEWMARLPLVQRACLNLAVRARRV